MNKEQIFIKRHFELYLIRMFIPFPFTFHSINFRIVSLPHRYSKCELLWIYIILLCLTVLCPYAILVVNKKNTYTKFSSSSSEANNCEMIKKNLQNIWQSIKCYFHVESQKLGQLPTPKREVSRRRNSMFFAFSSFAAVLCVQFSLPAKNKKRI